LDDAIRLKKGKGGKFLAYFISGEIFFRQGKYKEAINDLEDSISYGAKLNKLYIILGNSYFFEAKSYNCNNGYYLNALKNYEIALRREPDNCMCLKNCAYIYERQKDYSKTLEILRKLLSINEKDSLILCYYGEILNNMERYNESISYLTKASNIDPGNVHKLYKKAITHYLLQEYDKALLDFNKVVQLDSSNSFAYYYIGQNTSCKRR
jgi:tetratricopeptide (TPR) repeat protein